MGELIITPYGYLVYHIHFTLQNLRKYTKRDKIWIPRSAQHLVILISEIPVNLNDSNGVICISISALGSKKWHLPVFCLHYFSQNPWDISRHIICCWKDIFKGNTAQLESWETVQWGWSYSRNQFDEYDP